MSPETSGCLHPAGIPEQLGKVSEPHVQLKTPCSHVKEEKETKLYNTGSSAEQDPPAVQETQETSARSPGEEDSLEKKMATYSSILGKIFWEINKQPY